MYSQARERPLGRLRSVSADQSPPPSPSFQVKEDVGSRPATSELIDEFASMPLFSSRLEDVAIRVWTKVSIDNELAIRVISFYFHVDYPLTPLFDADLFIEDLARGRRRFCSELLVNCLLCYACVSLSI